MRPAAWSMLAALALAATAPAEELPDVAAQIPWEIQQRDDDPDMGFTIFGRKQPGARHSSFKLEAVIDAPAELVHRAALENLADPLPQKSIDTVLLRREQGRLVSYRYVHLPLVADRDLTIEAVYSHDPESGVYAIDWSSTDDEGPAPREGVVRIPEAGGYWRFIPLDDGRTFALYESYTELGGSIPGWLVDSFIRDSIVEQIGNLRGRVDLVRRGEANRNAPASRRGKPRPEA